MSIKDLIKTAQKKLRALSLNDVLALAKVRLVSTRADVGKRLGHAALFGGGFVLGASAALLVAPMRGKDMRELLARWLGQTIGVPLQKLVTSSKEGAEQASEEVGAEQPEGNDGVKNGKKTHARTPRASA